MDFLACFRFYPMILWWNTLKKYHVMFGYTCHQVLYGGGVYSNSHKWIEGLSNFMITYGVRPYYMLSLEYVGGGHFNVKVFSPTVEINYETKYSDEDLEGMSRGFFRFPDLEIDSLSTIIWCNAYSSGYAASDLLISSSHLKKKRFYKVIFWTIFCK